MGVQQRFGRTETITPRHIQESRPVRPRRGQPDRQEQAITEAALTGVINRLIFSADSLVQRSGNSIGGKIKKFAVNAFVDWDELHRRAPELARAAFRELATPETSRKLKELAKKKVTEYAAQTGDVGPSKNADVIPGILQRYGEPDVNAFSSMARGRIDALQSRTYRFAYVMIGSMLLLLLLWWILAPRIPEIRLPLFGVSVALGLVVLTVALSTPILDIDARLKQVDLVLLGSHVRFVDQVLFYETRSILGVVSTLMTTKKPDSIFVGLLLLAFSILFPIAKLIAAEIHLLGNERGKASRLVHFLAFKSGKWSMADVTVVAIFMAYVGFRGILNDQLAGLNFSTGKFSSVATNQTSLQPGFLLFLAFVCYSLILSEILNWMSRRNEDAIRSTTGRKNQARPPDPLRKRARRRRYQATFNARAMSGPAWHAQTGRLMPPTRAFSIVAIRALAASWAAFLTMTRTARNSDSRMARSSCNSSSTACSSSAPSAIASSRRRRRFSRASAICFT